MDLPPEPIWVPSWLVQDQDSDPLLYPDISLEGRHRREPIAPGAYQVQFDKPYYTTLAGSSADPLGQYCGHVKDVFACGHDQDHIQDDWPNNIVVRHISCNDIVCKVCRKHISTARAVQIVEKIESKLMDLNFNGIRFGYFNLWTWSLADSDRFCRDPRTFNELRQFLKETMKDAGSKASFEFSHMFRLTKLAKKIFSRSGFNGPIWDFIIQDRYFDPAFIKLSPHFHCGGPSFLQRGDKVYEKTGWYYHKYRQFRLRPDGSFTPIDKEELIRHISYLINHSAQWGNSDYDAEEINNPDLKGRNVLNNLTWSGYFSSQFLRLKEGYPKTVSTTKTCKLCNKPLVKFLPGNLGYWQDDPTGILTYDDPDHGLMPTLYALLLGFTIGEECLEFEFQYRYELVSEFLLWPSPFPGDPP